MCHHFTSPCTHHLVLTSLVISPQDEEVSALAGEFKSVLGLTKAEALKLARVAVDDFGALTWAKFKSMDTADLDEAIGSANLKKLSKEALNSVNSSLSSRHAHHF